MTTWTGEWGTAAFVLTDIADAIREKDHIAGSIPVANFAARIHALPTGPPPPWPNNRRVYRFPNFLTTAQQVALDLVRLDGAPAYETLDLEIFNLFKESTWINLVGYIRALPAGRTYDTLHVVGHKLYLGGSGTTIPVINTLTGRVTEIEGLPNRAYNLFHMVGTKMYCLHGASNLQSINSIVCIDTVTDEFKLIMVPSYGYGQMAQVGHRLFLGPRNNNTTTLPFIDLNTDTSSSVGGLPSNTHGTLIPVGDKLYVSQGAGSANANNIRVIDTTKIDVAGENPVTLLTVPSGLYVAWQLVQNRYLYGGSQYTTTDANGGTHIIRIDTQNDTVVQSGNLPIRVYAVENTQVPHGPERWVAPFELVGNRLYVGSSTSGASIVVLNHLTGAFLREIGDLPNRAYTGLRLVSPTKMYLETTTQATSLVVIDPSVDTAEQITGLPNRAYNRTYLNGNILYLFTNSFVGITLSITSVVLVDTTDNSFTQITGLQNRTHTHAILAHDNKLYLGSGPIIDLTTNTLIQEVPEWNVQRMIYADDKIYSIPGVMSTSVLPYQPYPTYIKYGS